MISRIEEGEAEGILTWHPDRLARNSVDGGRIIYLINTGKIATLKFPTFWFDSTPQGKFMLNIALGQSKYYVDNLSENIRRGIRQKLRNGIWPAYAPLGYVNDKEKRNIVIDKPKAKLVKKAFELYATGEYPLSEIRKKINIASLVGKREKLLSVSNYQYMLKNPIYYGVIRYNGELYNGKHEPIITKKLFDSVQEVMKKNPNQRGGYSSHMYIADFSVAESVVALSPLKLITICGLPNGKILVRKNTRGKKSSLHKDKRKSKKFLCLPLGWMRAYKN